MKNCIQSVMSTLKNKVPQLRWVDMNLGQMNMEHPPVSYPCVLVDLSYIKHSNTGRGSQLGYATLEIELFFNVNSPSNNTAPQAMQEQAFQHFDIVEKVNQAISGLSGETFSTLNRTDTKRNAQYYPRAFTLIYQTIISSQSTKNKYTPLPNIKPKITNQH